MSTKGDGETATTLPSLPQSIICFGISQFLTMTDILALSSSCKSLHRTLIPSTGGAGTGQDGDDTIITVQDGNIDMLWKKVLDRDFNLRFGSYGIEDKNSVFVIPVQQESGVSNVQPEGPNGESTMVRPIRSSFEACKCWKITSLLFYKESRRLDKGADYHVNGGLFIRAALLWQKIATWCGRNGFFGSSLLETFKPGLDDSAYLVQSDNKPASDVMAELTSTFGQAMAALYVFCGGQVLERISFQEMSLSLLGTYAAYTECWFTPLAAPIRNDDGTYELVTKWGMPQSPLVFNPRNGSLVWVDKNSTQLAKAGLSPSLESDDSLLIWMEEYVRRLTSNVYRVGSMLGPGHNFIAINLYPWPERSDETNSGGIVSRCVTKGIEVVASAVYAPQAVTRGGMEFIYSLRMRLLTEGEEGYMSEEERGYVAAQLQSRHWKIYDRSTNTTDSVDGEGVVGMYPVLEDGGFREPAQSDNSFHHGWFSYQSCTGPMLTGGTFSGHMRFRALGMIAGDGGESRTLNSSSQEFDVQVGTFELNKSHDFLY